MQISKGAIRLLRWMRRDDEWRYQAEIERNCKYFTSRSFHALKNCGFVDACVFEDEIVDYTDHFEAYYPEHYRISDLGKAYLEERAVRWLPELREWIAIGISVVALAVSIVALIAGLS